MICSEFCRKISDVNLSYCPLLSDNSVGDLCWFNLLHSISIAGLERVTPEERGTFNCDPSYVVEVHTADTEAAQLDDDRIAQG